MNREFDIIVYGASGFTARNVIKDLVETNLKIALCGRSEEKIRLNIEGLPSTASNLPIIVSNTEDLPQVTRRGKVVLNCAGPYILCGEEVVHACLSTGTHYLDITGEPLFVEKIIKKYQDEAAEKKVFIVPCCGFDSVPADIGVMFLKQVLDCKPVWARSYVEFQNTYINHTTYDTVIHSIKNMNTLRRLRSNDKNEKIKDDNVDEAMGSTSEKGKDFKDEEIVEKDRLRKIPFFNSLTETYCTLFLGSDAFVVKRSQKLLVQNKLSEGIQYSAYYSVGKFLTLVSFLCWMAAFYLICQFECGRKILMRYPEIFTFGRVRKTGPSEEMKKNSSFKFLFEGLGIKEGGGEESPKRKRVIVKVAGPDPGYIATPICSDVCAILLVDMVMGKWKSPFQGGVLTPASAFHGSDIIDRLQKKGIKFEEVKETD